MPAILTLLICSKSFSQLEKKTWLVGGDANYRKSNYETNGGLPSKGSNAQLNGNVGNFIIDKLVFGLKFSYNRIEGFNPNYVVNTYSLGPLVRYYLLQNEKNVNIFTEISYQYGLSKNSQNSSSNKSNDLQGYVGCAAFFNSSVALEFKLGYSNYGYNNSSTVKSLLANIGFQFHLQKEK